MMRGRISGFLVAALTVVVMAISSVSVKADGFDANFYFEKVVD